MKITILGTESLGVRGLACFVELKDRKIFIDPGIALGWIRYGFLPHPFQVAVGSGIRERIIEKLHYATDVVISHFDGDHCPLFDANPYQLALDEIRMSLMNTRIWAKGPENSSQSQRERRKAFSEMLKKDLPVPDGMKDGVLEFSVPVPHGRRGAEKGAVMMTCIEEDGEIFVHASDIQLLDIETIRIIADWKPDMVFASGPPLYRYSSSEDRIFAGDAWNNALELSNSVSTLVIDHHLLRGEIGRDWIEKLRHTSGNNIICAADFMNREPLLLEAWRKDLYDWLPVPENWHDDYKHGKADFENYRIKGWECLLNNGKIKPCKWYHSCPVKHYTDKGKLERYWIENYCLVGNKNCVRYNLEEKGEYHPDYMLPDGEIKKNL
ncbi:MAG: hypothetical protein JW864_01865 [Spirochaetes bacterium]|nr:hypothetical protein [Spirochaetota bacterium]